ncbi:MAG: DNA primase [Chlamydiales bacterium]|nr:DNA primase [Chlamydiales bacterium]
MYTKESLQNLKEKVDLIEVVSSQIEVKRAGTAYKALCPFHDEKSPSFTLKRGDSHYHCFGCGAHGDSIQFLMQLQGVTFREAVEMLAERFHVPLQEDEKSEKGISTLTLQSALVFAQQFYHFYLLRTEEGRVALNYLLKRGLSLDFIKQFELGYAPSNGALFMKALKEKKFSQEVLIAAGLLTQDGQRPFFRERITFPVHNARGSVIAFSARKIKEETYGGKYINSPETQLFKKSRHLFGLNYSRRRIVKDRRALLVEGQIDCLKLIEAGLDYTVAALGTAFGEGHVTALKNLGVHQVKIAFDSDTAGVKAASKAGDLFQKVGIEVEVITLPDGSDPDTFLKEHGLEKFQALPSHDYLTYQMHYLAKTFDLKSPAAKAELVKQLTAQIKAWDDPVMVHESLRKLAQLTRLPEEMIGVSYKAPRYVRANGANPKLDPNHLLEIDLLRILLQGESAFRDTVQRFISSPDFMIPACRKLYNAYLKADETDLFSIMADIDDPAIEACVDEIMSKKINRDKAEEIFLLSVQRIVDRSWLAKREAIKKEILTITSDDEKLALAKKFDATTRPEVRL